MNLRHRTLLAYYGYVAMLALGAFVLTLSVHRDDWSTFIYSLLSCALISIFGGRQAKALHMSNGQLWYAQVGALFAGTLLASVCTRWLNTGMLSGVLLIIWLVLWRIARSSPANSWVRWRDACRPSRGGEFREFIGRQGRLALVSIDSRNLLLYRF